MQKKMLLPRYAVGKEKGQIKKDAIASLFKNVTQSKI